MHKKSKMQNFLRFRNFLLTNVLLLSAMTLHAQLLPVEKVSADFKTMLQRPSVDGVAVLEIKTTDSLVIEKGYFYSEPMEKVPVLIYKPASAEKTFPVVICLHGTGGNKEGMKDLMLKLTKAGFMAVAIDARYHGERVSQAPGENKYVEAIIRAWENKDPKKQQHPFFFDTVYDLWKLVDYLVWRKDVQTDRIGMIGISMGGIETWMAASVDTRIKVAVPVIAVQSFKWSLENNRWQGRARTIWGAHTAAAREMGDTGVNQSNVKKFWDKLLPGITNEFDCPSMIRLFAPRPLLILNTEKDPNCPLPGAEIAFATAKKAYVAKNATDKLKIDVEPNEPHRFTPRHMEMAVEWFKKWL
jgi:dienelactone hydrolase